MNLVRAITLLLASVLLCACASQPTDVPSYTRSWYAATFGITLDKDGELLNFRLVEILDPNDRSRTPLPIHPSKAYMASARQVVLDKKYKPEIVEGHPKEFFTWLYYVPRQPDRADLNPAR